MIHIHFIDPIQNGFIQCIENIIFEKRKIDASSCKADCVDQCFRSANADASDMVVDVWLFLWEDDIFAKQTNDVHMRSGYHLFIFHICELSADARARSHTFRGYALANPFFYCQPTWHHLSRFIFIGQPQNIFGIYRAKIERNNDENQTKKKKRSHPKEKVDVVPVNNTNALSAPHITTTTVIMLAIFD